MAKPTVPGMIERWGGVSVLCERLTSGAMMTHLAGEIGISIGALIAWIAAADERSVRVREARSAAAQVWDEKAETVLLGAPADKDEIARAKELAQHYRWRASKMRPREYGDRIELSGEVGIKDLSVLIEEGRKRARGE